MRAPPKLPTSKKLPKRAYDRTSYVLIVDDDPTLLKFFKIHLNKFFSRVIVVDTAKAALDHIQTKEIDLVLTDFVMPKMNGIDLLRKIRKKHPGLPVYIISGGQLDTTSARECIEESDGFLRKPFTIEEIQNFIEFGMKKREVLKKLAAAVEDPKKLSKLLEDHRQNKKITTKSKILLDLLAELRDLSKDSES